MKITLLENKSTLKNLPILQVFSCSGKYYIKVDHGGGCLDLSDKLVRILNLDLIVYPHQSELVIHF